MKLVADTNILFSFFNGRSRARQISVSREVMLHTPEFAFKELDAHKHEIIEAFSLKEQQFAVIMKLLTAVVEFVPEETYSAFLPDAKKISPDPDDVDFFALALKLGCGIWSNEKRLKQPEVRVLATEDLVQLLGL